MLLGLISTALHVYCSTAEAYRLHAHYDHVHMSVTTQDILHSSTSVHSLYSNVVVISELIIQSTTPEDIMETAKNFLMEQTKQGSPKGRKTRPQEALAKVR